MDAFSGSFTSAEIATNQWFCLISILLSLAATVLVLVSRRRIFKKLGLPGWKGIIPIYGDYTLFKNRWKVKPFWALMISNFVYYGGIILTGFVMSNNLSAVTAFSTIEEIKSFFIPYIVIYGLSALAYAIISMVITIALNYRLSETFEHGFWFALGLTILPFVFYPLLAFAKKQETRKKRPLQMVSTVLTLALVFSIVTCAPFTVSAAETDPADTGASYEGLAGTSAGSEAPFGELSEGKYTLESIDYQLTEDFAAEGYIYVPSDVTATIDLNGHTIDRGLSNAGTDDYADFIVNDGNLTITDSSGDDSGMITGGYAAQGGAVYNNCALTIEGGTITGNRASGDGGAIYSAGDLRIDGGTIKQNYAKLQGGAILNSADGTLTVSGGTITDNCAENNGGGIYVRNGSTIKMYDDPVIKENAGSNLVLAGNSIINVDYYFTTGAEVDISAAGNMPRAVTSDFGEYHSSASVFTFGSGHTAATLDANGEIVPDIPSNATHVTTWDELKNAVDTRACLINRNRLYHFNKITIEAI